MQLPLQHGVIRRLSALLALGVASLSSPALSPFGSYLNDLLRQGIRPPGSEREGVEWGKKEFARAVGRGDRQIYNWLDGSSLPPDTIDIERALFGKNAKSFSEQRQNLRRLLERSKSAKSSNAYAKESTVELMWDYIFSHINEASSEAYDFDADNVRDISWIISAIDERITKSYASEISRKARYYVFDQKYGAWNEDLDERYALGIDKWNEEFLFILEKFGITFESTLLCVGIGCGLEGRDIYRKFQRLLAVDLSAKAVLKAKQSFPDAEIVEAEAEDLPRGFRDVDVYISLKTYSSSFFDIDQSIKSCSERVRSGGIAIISVPKGYLTESGFIAGLSRTIYNLHSARERGTYNVPDKMYCFELLQKIVYYLHLRLFYNIHVLTGITEHYIIAFKR